MRSGFVAVRTPCGSVPRCFSGYCYDEYRRPRSGRTRCGVAKGLGGLGQKGAEAAGEAAKGAVEQLFGGQKKEKTR